MKEDWKHFTVAKRAPEAIREKPDDERLRQHEARQRIERLNEERALRQQFDCL